jgi:hypothetical protein
LELDAAAVTSRSARGATVVIGLSQEPPAFVRLALDVGLTGFSLGVERVELKVEVMFGGLASIDCAAEGLRFGRLHVARSAAAVRRLGCAHHSGRTPKNRGPLQAVPVTARAMVERLV